MTTTVSFYITSLLKEKGFLCHRSDRFWRDGFSYEKKDYNPIAYQDKDNVATIFEVVMWLYEKHRIWINIDVEGDNYNKFFFQVYRSRNEKIQELIKKINDSKYHSNYTSINEAYEAAIEYCLTNLIKEEKK